MKDFDSYVFSRHDTGGEDDFGTTEVIDRILKMRSRHQKQFQMTFVEACFTKIEWTNCDESWLDLVNQRDAMCCAKKSKWKTSWRWDISTMPHATSMLWETFMILWAQSKCSKNVQITLHRPLLFQPDVKICSGGLKKGKRHRSSGREEQAKIPCRI